MKYLLFIFFLFSSVFSSVHANNQRVKTIHSMLDIHPYLTQKPLVVFDLDNTLILSKTDLGSPHWFRAWQQMASFRGLSLIHEYKSLQNNWQWLQNYVEYQLTENNLPYLVKNLKQSPKAMVFGLTSRPPYGSKPTLDTLDKLNISLEKPIHKNLQLDFFTPKPIYFTEGVIFGGMNTKPLLLKELMRNLQQQKQSFDRLIFIDDNQKNVEAVKRMCEKLGVDYVGLKYAHPKVNGKNFSFARAQKQYEILKFSLSNQDAEKILSSKHAAKVLKGFSSYSHHPKRIDSSISTQGQQAPLSLPHNLPRSESKIIESYHLDELTRYVHKNSLVILGIGDTLVTTDSLLGSSSWGWEIVSKNLNKGIPIEQSAEQLLPIWNDLIGKIPFIPSEVSTPDVIRKIEKKGAITMGITSHYVEAALVVLRGLKNLGIDFSASLAAKKDFSLTTPYPSKVLSGILFTGFQNSKGHALLDFLDKVNLHYQQIIFVDNNLEYIQEIQKAAAILQKPFLGIWYKKGEQRHGSIHPDIAKIQWIYQEKILPNHLTDILLQKSPFTDDFSND